LPDISTEYLNPGAALLSDPAERRALAELDFSAGKRAKAATTYEAAAGYLAAGMALLPETSWEDDYPLYCNRCINPVLEAPSTRFMLWTHEDRHREDLARAR
jgi:predicted ATPase